MLIYIINNDISHKYLNRFQFNRPGLLVIISRNTIEHYIYPADRINWNIYYIQTNYFIIHCNEANHKWNCKESDKIYCHH